MKRVLKNVVLLMILAVILMTLTACGNTVTGTKTITTETGEKIEETIEIEFKNDKAIKIKKTFEYESAEVAAVWFDAISMILPEGCVTHNGKKVVIELSEEYIKDFGEAVESTATKKEVKAQLESEGYKVK